MANPVFVKTTDSYIAALMKVTLNAAPGNTYLNQFRSFVTENGGGTTGLQKLGSALANYASTDNAAFAASVVANLGITGTSATTATTNVKALLDSYGADRGKALMQLVDVMVNLQSDATWGAAANTFVNAANAGYVYSVNTANTSTDLTVLAAAVSTTGGVVATPGQTFTLTAGAPFDNFASNSAVAASKTTAGDDLFRAVVNNSLETNDAIDAGAGNDTVKANVSANAATTTIQPLLKDLENVFLNATVTGGAGATAGTVAGANASVVFDATDATGLKAVWSEASTLAAVVPATGATGASGTATLTFQNLKLGTEVGVKDTTSGATFAFAGATGAADAATLNLADASGGAAVTIAAIENLTIKSNAGDLSAVTANNAAVTAAQAETVTVTGAQALTLALTGANVATIDSTGFDKALTLGFTTTAATPVTIKGGVGADTFNITDVVTGGKVTIDLGAGNDTLNISDSAFHAITTGEGKDTINVDLTTAAHKNLDVSTAAKLEASAIVITDFTSGSDILNVNSAYAGAAGAGEINLTGTQLAAIAGSANLLTAANAALAAANATKGLALAAGDGTVFQYGGSTYVVIDEAIGIANTIEAGDTLIKLTGVTSVVAADVTIA